MSCLDRETELREKLLRENEEYRQLAAEHQAYDAQLEEYSNKHFLSEEEEVQEKLLKKKKLLIKDQMHLMVQKIIKQMQAGS
jgi:uncharacterized protein YdcH (DUF465 family)